MRDGRIVVELEVVLRVAVSTCSSSTRKRGNPNLGYVRCFFHTILEHSHERGDEHAEVEMPAQNPIPAHRTMGPLHDLHVILRRPHKCLLCVPFSIRPKSPSLH